MYQDRTDRKGKINGMNKSLAVSRIIGAVLIFSQVIKAFYAFKWL